MGTFTQSCQDKLMHHLSPLAARVSLAWPVPGLGALEWVLELEVSNADRQDR